jgi:hypothetical protein
MGIHFHPLSPANPGVFVLGLVYLHFKEIEPFIKLAHEKYRLMYLDSDKPENNLVMAAGH